MIGTGYLFVEDVAERLRLTARSIQRMCKRGDFPNAFKAGKYWRIPASDVDRYISRQKKERQTARA